MALTFFLLVVSSLPAAPAAHSVPGIPVRPNIPIIGFRSTIGRPSAVGEIPATDIERAAEFYGALLGYSTETFDLPGDNDYQVLMRDGRRRAGIIHLPWEEVVPNWLPYVNVEDPIAVAQKVEELGGVVLIPPRPDIRNGSVGVVTDPSGAAFAIQKWPVDDDDMGGRP